MENVTTQKFLEALSHDKKYFRTFGGNSTGYNGGRNYGPYTHDEVDSFLKPFNEQEHRDCFVIINDGGHKSADITRATAQFIDFDAGREDRCLGDDGKWSKGTYYSTKEVEKKKNQFKIELKKLIEDGIIPEPSIIVEEYCDYGNAKGFTYYLTLIGIIAAIGVAIFFAFPWIRLALNKLGLRI